MTVAEDDGSGNADVQADQIPPLAMKARARAAHSAARTWVGFSWSRSRQHEHDRTTEKGGRAYKKAKIDALRKAAALATVGGASASTGDAAAMNEVADVTKRRGIPMITGDVFRVYRGNLKQMAIPRAFPLRSPGVCPDHGAPRDSPQRLVLCGFRSMGKHAAANGQDHAQLGVNRRCWQYAPASGI